MPEPRNAPAVPPPLPRCAPTPAPAAAGSAALPLLTAVPAPGAPAAPVLTPVAPAPPVLAAPAAVPALAPAAQVPLAPLPVPGGPAPAPGLPSAEEAEAVLSAALRGEPAADPAWRAAAEALLPALSEGERTALTSGPLSFDPALLRGAAGLRLRLDLAIALAPSRPDLHADALPALLAEVDAAMLGLKSAAAEAAPAAAAALDPIRGALLDGGVALAGAMARTAPAAAEAPLAPAAAPARPAARVLSNERGTAEAAGGKRYGMWIALALALAAAGGYRAWLASARSSAPPVTFPDAPANTLGVERGGMRMLTALPGKSVNPAELARFIASEGAKGNVVKQAGPGTWLITPAASAPPATERAP